jgi:hypothetical protein
MLFNSNVPAPAPVGGTRGGLASRGATPQYSPALRWVTTGFGMGPGGATALWATSPPDRIRGADCADEGDEIPGGNKASLGKGDVHKTVLGHEHGSAPVGCPPSTCRLATRSSAGGLTLSYQMGRLVLRRGSHLDAFSGSPVRT